MFDCERSRWVISNPLGASTMTIELITIKGFRELAKIGPTSIYAGIKSGIFPKPIKVGRASRWLRSEVEASISELARKRTQA